MDCGTPFCQMGEQIGRETLGCPLYNLIPEWNELVREGQWYEAYLRLAKTNNFPEFTGRACPAPCEGSCTAGLVSEPVAIKSIEREIIDKAFEEGWVKATPPHVRSNKHVAVIGSGPAGLAAADELNRLGHHVTVFEKEDRVGGLLMYGIPNMKIDKSLVDRRVKLLKEEGISFKTNLTIGKDLSFDELRKIFDSVVICTGADKHRELQIPGHHLKGIYPAMTYLTESTRQLLEDQEPLINAKGKRVIVIGGGDTGADCVATALRQNCSSVVQFGKHDRLPDERADHNPWPQTPRTFTLDYAYEEAHSVFGEDPRQYQITTTAFKGDANGNVAALEAIRTGNSDKEQDTEPVLWEADLVLIAIGFEGISTQAARDFSVHIENGKIVADNKTWQTNLEDVFVAGDARRGQSLIVWAIQEGRKAALSVHHFLAEKKSRAVQ
jgi:glutamate synthase (NADPH/NADH) small chain